MLTLLVPDLLWDGRVTREGWGLLVDGDTETMRRVGVVDDLRAAAAGRPLREVQLARSALMAAPVNAHSHAFQRAIRGRTQTRPTAHPEADFWSWRAEMYRAVLSLDPDDLHTVSKACFAEMRDAGWGSVGEFHYVHRAPDGHPYDDPLVLSDAVIAAAREVGLRICLLYVAYATSDVDGSPLLSEQRRFRSDSPEAVLAAVSDLRSRWSDDAGVSVGIAPHSVRAVPRAWWRPLAEGAHALDVPLHAHVSEQRREVEACLATHGRRPVELLADEGVLSARFTAVHATHLTAAEIQLLADSGAGVCACPSTERDLGDGVLQADQLRAAGVPISLGSDSQTLIDPWEELRLPEYHLRLTTQRRIVLGEDEGGITRWAPAALRAATECGGTALRTGAGRIEPGAPADLVTLDLDHPALVGIDADTFPEVVAVAGRAGVAQPVEISMLRG